MAAFDKTSATHNRLSPVCHRLKRFRTKRLAAAISMPQENTMTRLMKTAVDHFPIAGSFTISRGSKTTASVVTCHVSDGVFAGMGECVPYARYGETIDGVLAEIEAIRSRVEAGIDREELRQTMKAGAARNAVDCALWDLAAKKPARAPMPWLGLPSRHRLPPPTRFRSANRRQWRRRLRNMPIGRF